MKKMVACAMLALATFTSAGDEPTLRDRLRKTVIPDFTHVDEPMQNVLFALQEASKKHGPKGKGIQIHRLQRTDLDMNPKMVPVTRLSATKKKDDDEFGADDWSKWTTTISMTSASVWDILEQLRINENLTYELPSRGNHIVVHHMGGGHYPASLAVYPLPRKLFALPNKEVDFHKKLALYGYEFPNYFGVTTFCRYHGASGKLLVMYTPPVHCRLEKQFGLEPVDLESGWEKLLPEFVRPTWAGKTVPQFKVTNATLDDALKELAAVCAKQGLGVPKIRQPNREPKANVRPINLEVKETTVEYVLIRLSVLTGQGFWWSKGVGVFGGDLRLIDRSFHIDPRMFDGADKKEGFDIEVWLETHGVRLPMFASGMRATATYDPEKKLLKVNLLENDLKLLSSLIRHLTPLKKVQEAGK